MQTWAIANQKGGVGKTTTSLCLARGLAADGARVVLIDLDPHASLTRAFAVPTDPPPAGSHDLFNTGGAAELRSLARGTAIDPDRSARPARPGRHAAHRRHGRALAPAAVAAARAADAV